MRGPLTSLSSIAQLEEHPAVTRVVVGSNPARGARDRFESFRISLFSYGHVFLLAIGRFIPMGDFRPIRDAAATVDYLTTSNELVIRSPISC